MPKSERPVEELIAPGRKAAKKVVHRAAEPLRAAADATAVTLSRFGEVQGASGIVLIAAATLAVIVANSPLSEFYNSLLHHKLTVQLGPLLIAKSVAHWVNDGLMALFFFLVGLEIKREFVEGRLQYPSQIVLPFFAAAGGMAIPAAMFAVINFNQAELLQGWAIPMATDIAFALGVLALCGDRVPVGLKVFLLSLAIFDDLGAIVAIALFYGDGLDAVPLGIAFAIVVMLMATNLAGVRRIGVYLVLGAALWIAVLKSGVHATLAGVIVALTVPIAEHEGHSPLRSLEDRLDPWIAYFVMPVFALANAGLSFDGLGFQAWGQPLTLGILVGLLLGKPIGVCLGAGIVVLSGRSKLPDGVSWLSVIGVGFLSGIGFTMSLFIGTLAFNQVDRQAQVQLGVFSASVLAAVLGYAIVTASLRRAAES